MSGVSTAKRSATRGHHPAPLQVGRAASSLRRMHACVLRWRHLCKALAVRLTVPAVLIAFAITSTAATSSAQAQSITVYKTPSCGCCTKWADHLSENGFTVTVRSLDDLSSIKSSLAVPRVLRSCHTAEIDGYVVEGHVPANDIRRLLQQRPDAAGLAVPGMPLGSPGMEHGARKDPYDVFLFGDGEQTIYASH